MSKKSLFVTVIAVFTFGLKDGGTATPSTAEGQLIHDLFDTGYDVRVMPQRDLGHPLEMTINFYLFSILDVDTKNGILSGVSFVNILWHDQRLVWNPANYSNISEITVPLGSAWTPPMQIYNTAGYGQTHTIFQKDGNVLKIFADGTAYIQSNMYYNTICNTVLLDFPFDSHNCSIGFFIMGYYSDRIKLVPGRAYSLFNYNTEWKIKNLVFVPHDRMDIVTRKNISFLDAVMHLERAPNFYLRIILCPLVLLNGLALSTFWIPIKSGERVSASLSLVLGNTVFQIIISDIMPRTSDPEFEPRIVYFCVSSFALITAITVWSMLVSNLAAKKWSLRTSAARRLFLEVLPVLTCTKSLKGCRTRAAVKDISMQDDEKQEVTAVHAFDHTTKENPGEQRGDESQTTDMEIVAEMLDRFVMVVVCALLITLAVSTDPLITSTLQALFH
ncbi:acetylcholine receptor subunit alpha-1-B-like [Lytechinus pictus]|uniref:acetylcholine receptor subunit alpha-1-B-like n=1 Tax=Lytechinus pictus TaxID=7653 RepID=UPI0030B9F2CA